MCQSGDGPVVYQWSKRGTSPARMRRARARNCSVLGKGEHAVPAYRYRGFSGDRLVVIVQ
jgi:hypothetical protein